MFFNNEEQMKKRIFNLKIITCPEKKKTQQIKTEANIKVQI